MKLEKTNNLNDEEVYEGKLTEKEHTDKDKRVENTNQNITGYPSVDKPWLKYYSDEAINSQLPNESLYGYLYKNNKEHKNDIAINYFGKKLTYGDLFNEIDVVSKAFITNGVEVGDVITVVSVSTVVSILCFYALNKIGAISNYVNVLSSEDDLIKYFEESKTRMVVTLDLFGEKVLSAAKKSGVKRVIQYSLSNYMPKSVSIIYHIKSRKSYLKLDKNELLINWDEFIFSGKQTELYVKNSKNPLEVCFYGHTGGTTGFPKTVLLNDYQMNAIAHQYNVCIKHERGEKFLNCIVPFVVYGILICMHMPLTLGLELIVIPKFEAKNWKSIFKKYKPNHVLGIPSYILPMLEDKTLSNVDMSCLKTIAVGGDGMNEKLEREMNEFLKMHNAHVCISKGYGMTEVCATATTEFSGFNHMGSVGFPLLKNNIKIYDNKKRHELRYGEVGEICINSPSIMMGYLEREKETNDLLQIHDDGEKWVHTGDLGYVTEEGYLYVTGRMKRMIFLGPEGMLYKVFPKTIEDVICEVDGIKEACVVSYEKDNNLYAKVFLVEDIKQNTSSHFDLQNEIIEKCKKELPEYMIPVRFDWLETFPLTSIGKIDYKKLENTISITGE